MKNLILSFLILCSTLTFAQDYMVEGNNIVVTKVVENVAGSKDEIYNRVKSYFVRSYGNANSVIQTDDKEGGLIIGRGLYTNLASFNLGAWTTKAHHLIRVDIKDGRVRIIANASTIIPNSSAHLGNEYEYEIIKHIPLTNKKAPIPKKASEESFKALVANLNASVNSLEKAVKEGGQLNSEKSDW